TPPRANAENLLYRALADEHPPSRTLDHDRHAAPLEVERDFVQLVVLLRHRAQSRRLRVMQDRDIQQILEAGLVVAVEIGAFEDLAALLPEHIERPLQDD